MASAGTPLRLCLRACRGASAQRALAQRVHPSRAIATSRICRSDQSSGNPGRSPAGLDVKIDLGLAKTSARRSKSQLDNFWMEGEEDPDLILEEPEDDDFSEEDIMSMAHGKLEEHREYREYARIAAWQMPLLSKLARPFEPPTSEQILRFRYTTYMGESHPAQNKVVVEFSPQDMPLTEAQQLKLKKILGPRWNPETNVAKISCEQFDNQAQNKRYLGDLVQSLVAKAKDPTDMFEDVPLDTRHHKIKTKPRFPKEWRLTEERVKQIEDTRQKALLLDQARMEAGTLVDGTQKIEEAFAPAPRQKVPEMATVRSKLSPGRPAPRLRA